MLARATLVVVLLAAGASAVAGQSLADVARAEAERRKATAGPAKVYTNEDLRPEPNAPATPPAADAAPAPASPAAVDPAAKPEADAKAAQKGSDAASAPGTPRDEKYWKNRIAEARGKVERSRSFALALQNRVDMLWTDFVNRGDPVQQRAIEQERNKAIAELEQLRLEIAENEREVTNIEDEARREGVPPGWLRP